MANFVGVNNRVYVGQLDLSGIASEVNFGALSKVMQPCTTFNDGGFDCVKPGLGSGTAMVKGYQDYATGVFDDTISIAQLGSQYPITVIANPTGTVAVNDACWASRGLVGGLNPLDGAKGDMGEFQLDLPYDAAIVQSKVLAPKAAVTVDTTGTAVAMTGPTAAQKLYASLHVFAYSGFTNVVFTIQTDDAVGFPSQTTRITFATVTGLTSEFASVAGNFSTETHVRVFADVTGSGSITYAVTAGVL